MKHLILAATAALATACAQAPEEPTAEAHVPQVPSHNALTEAEIAEGWELLFDGTSTEGWRRYGDSAIGLAWTIDDEALHLDASNKNDWQVVDGGDIIAAGPDGATREWTNFHFKVDWRIQPKGNSGIMFLIHEAPETYPYPWQTGLEMQVLDNGTDSTGGHYDASIPKHRAGDLYDITACSEETVRPAGEWNQAEIVLKDGHLEFFLNGTKVVDRMLFDEQWTADVAASKFHEFPGYGTFKTGSIALQDHGDFVWFRNIKIKSLD